MTLMTELIQAVKILRTLKYFPNICVMLARITVAKPHAADVERLISANNWLKSPIRSTMTVEVVNLYLYKHYMVGIQFTTGQIIITKGIQLDYFNFFEASDKSEII